MLASHSSSWRSMMNPCTLEFLVARALLLFAIFILPYYNVRWPGGGAASAIALFALGALLVMFVLSIRVAPSYPRLDMLVQNATAKQLLVLGCFLQIVAALALHALPTSDSQTYLNLAERLIQTGTYADDAGKRAFWPPGLTLYLTPFLWLTGGGTRASVVLANVVLYLIAAISLNYIGRVLGGATTGKMAVVLFTIWPNRLLVAGLPVKEYLAVAGLCAGLALCMAAASMRGRMALAACGGAGFAFAAATLTQPGLMLLVLALPVMFRGWRREAAVRRLIAHFAVVALTTAVFIAPWQLRNCTVFHGQFCGVSTNGGSVFYRANNPLATGLWTPEGEFPIAQLPELEQNRVGYDLGTRWIREHPTDFLKLAIRKLVQFLGDDDYGAQFGVLMGKGVRYEQALNQSSPARLLSFHLASDVSLAFWLLLLALTARALSRAQRTLLPMQREMMLPLLYPLLYSAVVFCVFESGSRQHIACASLMIIVASWQWSTTTRTSSMPALSPTLR